MAKYKRSSNRPQPKHKKHKKSQHDKRRRLQSRNPKRKRTTAAKVPLTGAMQSAVSVLQAVMDARIAARLAIVVAGMLLADDRRTASAWFVAAGVRDDWDRFYDCLISVGRTSEKLAAAMLGLIVQKFAPALGDRILLAMDDSPTGAMDGTSKAPVSITIRRPDRRTASGSTDTTGLPWPGWQGIRCGA